MTHSFWTAGPVDDYRQMIDSNIRIEEDVFRALLRKSSVSPSTANNHTRYVTENAIDSSGMVDIGKYAEYVSGPKKREDALSVISDYLRTKSEITNSSVPKKRVMEAAAKEKSYYFIVHRLIRKNPSVLTEDGNVSLEKFFNVMIVHGRTMKYEEIRNFILALKEPEYLMEDSAGQGAALSDRQNAGRAAPARKNGIPEPMESLISAYPGYRNDIIRIYAEALNITGRSTKEYRDSLESLVRELGGNDPAKRGALEAAKHISLGVVADVLEPSLNRLNRIRKNLELYNHDI